VGCAALFALVGAALGAVKDGAFLQDSSVKFQTAPELAGARFRKVVVDRDGVVFVLTDKGVARLFENTLALDHSFRPLNGLHALDIALYQGDVYYLFEDRFLSNGSAGEPLGMLPKGNYSTLAVGDQSTALLMSEGKVQRWFAGKLGPVEGVPGEPAPVILTHRNEFFLAGSNGVYRVFGNRAKLFAPTPSPVTAMAIRGVELVAGTTNGFLGVSVNDASVVTPLQTRVPCARITAMDCDYPGDLWVGSEQGVYRVPKTGQVSYYASKRWLNDDKVIDLQRGPDGDVYVLTAAGLCKINFEVMTLQEKAAFYDRKVRQRHNRYGFAAELRLSRPGDITSAEMIDTDNDGSWSNYYMASQAFRYAATGDSEARSNAWQTFRAMERLERMPGLKGFPARTFERKGFKFSDPDRWRDAGDGAWEWKGHTSSDEIAAHTFGCAVMYEVGARNPTERERVVRYYEKIVTHILNHNWYLIDSDGKPTLWGRWHPDYVNHYPPSIGDRRLNSAEIIASLQLAYRMTNKDLYKKKAYELIDKYGYLTNILSSVTNITVTPGYVYEGMDMGSVWNHSDDLLSFITYWVLSRFAFNEELRQQYFQTIRDHWQIEKEERNPLWNFVYLGCGGRDFDLEGAIWTLRKFPLDLISWDIRNSHRKDVTPLKPNFREQQLKELLPPSERQITRWNTGPFILDGGDGGRTEFAGDEFLLPYWMARYLRAIR
jgi:hypothetical protein